jgi:hypothetical protein
MVEKQSAEIMYHATRMVKTPFNAFLINIIARLDFDLDEKGFLHVLEAWKGDAEFQRLWNEKFAKLQISPSKTTSDCLD